MKFRRKQPIWLLGSNGGNDLPAPGNIGGSQTSDTTSSITWTYPVGVSRDGFKVERSDNGGPFVQIGTTTNLFYNDTGLTPNTFYSYRVRAYKAAANSPYSITANIQTFYAEAWDYLSYAGFSYNTNEAAASNVAIGFLVDNGTWDKIYSINFVSPDGDETQALVDAKRLTQFINNGAEFYYSGFHVFGGTNYIGTDFVFGGVINPLNWSWSVVLVSDQKDDVDLFGTNDTGTPSYLNLKVTSSNTLLAIADSNPGNVLASSQAQDLGNYRFLTFGSIHDISEGALFLEYPDNGYVPDVLSPTAPAFIAHGAPYIGTINVDGGPSASGMSGYYIFSCVMGAIGADPIIDVDIYNVRTAYEIYNQYYGRT